MLGSAWLAGRVVRAHRQLADELARRNAELEVERHRTARLAVAEERTRIAREIHDLLAHTVSVMVVQAEAAEDLLDRDQARARRSLVAIQDTGREALTELRHLLGVLRDNASELDRSPQPGLHRLEELVRHFREAGLPVAVAREGDRRPLPPGIDLCAYRVVQEALTNSLKYAGDAHARVVIHYGVGSLDVHVTDDGRGTPRANGGHGLVGIRERVAMYGGQLDAGNGQGGGFEVHARLPYESGVE
jgi:signal transduction histidine kinase